VLSRREECARGTRRPAAAARQQQCVSLCESNLTGLRHQAGNAHESSSCAALLMG
jgi:hypothetical protein